MRRGPDTLVRVFGRVMIRPCGFSLTVFHPNSFNSNYINIELSDPALPGSSDSLLVPSRSSWRQRSAGLITWTAALAVNAPGMDRLPISLVTLEIGRASCRERVKVAFAEEFVITEKRHSERKRRGSY